MIVQFAENTELSGPCICTFASFDYDNDVSVHSVYIQTVFYGLCLIIKYILSYVILLVVSG